MLRFPVVAGRFYPGTQSFLEDRIEDIVDRKAAPEEVLGIISPHAGYNYSGAVAGAGISRVRFKDTFIILGPNHTGMGEPFSIMTEGVWNTPMGNVDIDEELAAALLESCPYLKSDVAAHMEEHSIEVQVPFLQYFQPDVKIVPIVLAGDPSGDVCREIGKGIAKTLKESGRKAVIMASSDMSHYEPQEAAKENDFRAIESILALDMDQLLARVREYHITMCGCAPVATLIAACNELGAKKAELVMYQTSGDVTGDYYRVVGYASVIIKK
ncbi:MAG: AmmeMemoRadiSam system protein B [Chloroflexota bacterium]|nr:AmmeMemoRadiSam system protein B [Chloroflexota bacterium]